MKILISVAMLAVVSTGGLAAAQPSSPDPGAKNASAAKKPVVRNASGIVKSTSPDTVVVGGRDKGKDAEWTFAVEPTTDIRKGTKSITAGDLKPGDAIHIRFTEQDGKATARSIIVRGKGAAQAPSQAKKAKP